MYQKRRWHDHRSYTWYYLHPPFPEFSYYHRHHWIHPLVDCVLPSSLPALVCKARSSGWNLPTFDERSGLHHDPVLVCSVVCRSHQGELFWNITCDYRAEFLRGIQKMAVNAIFLVGTPWVGYRSTVQPSRARVYHCYPGQMLCSQFWKEKYRPRNTVPWIIQLVSPRGSCTSIHSNGRVPIS